MPAILLTISLLIGIPNIVATILSISKKEYWWIRVFDYPKLQMILFMVLAIGCLIPLITTDSILILIYFSLLAITIIYQVIRIFPYTPLSKTQVLNASKNDQQNRISLVHCNLLMTNHDVEKCIDVITKHNPDVILTVEADDWWENALKPLEQDYRYTAKYPLGNTYGMILYSKLKLEDADFKFLVDDDVPSLNPLIELPSGIKINCFFIHPRPPVPGEADTSKPRDKELILVAKQAAGSEYPVIIAGDLNDVGWSYTSRLFQKISGLLDPRTGRGLFATFNANNKFFRWPLDHIFHSKEFRVIDIKVLEHMGSDHFPIYVNLSYEPEKAHKQKEPVADTEDIKEAKEKLS